jgi:hypothetical protein
MERTNVWAALMADIKRVARMGVHSALACFFPRDWNVMREYWLRTRLRQRTAASYGFLTPSSGLLAGSETQPLINPA